MSAVQYGKWGVGGCVTRRPSSNALRAGPHTVSSVFSALGVPAQSIALIFSYVTEGKPTDLQLCCKTSMNWGRCRGSRIADGCCVLSTLYSPSELVISFTWQRCERVSHNNIFFSTLLLLETDRVQKQISAFKYWQFLSAQVGKLIKPYDVSVYIIFS